MPTMEEIDKATNPEKVKQRKEELIRDIKKLGVNKTKDNRNLDLLRLGELEWLYVEAWNDKHRKVMYDY